MIIGVAQLPMAGENVCGDGYVILEQPEGLLLMLCDGTGHGPQAAAASALAADYVRAHETESLLAIMAGCGEKLRGTRGGAIALLRLDRQRSTIDFLSVGNVELRATCGASVAPICSPGMVGRPVRKMHPFSYPLTAGDRLVLFSDGISRRIDIESVRSLEPQAAAEALLTAHGVSHDDATCVVVDNRPRPSTSPAGPSRHQRESSTPIATAADVIVCGARAQQTARAIGFSEQAQQEMTIIARELASNIHKYAPGGEVIVRPLDAPVPGLELQADDRGPGIADVAAALRDGHSERPPGPFPHCSLGVGLGAVKRLADELSIEARAGGGTRIIARKHLPEARGSDEV